MKKQILKIIFLSIVFLLVPQNSKADWQSTLQSQFDIAETFDNLADWVGDGKINNFYYSKGDDMPDYLSGDPSRWTYYSYWPKNAPVGNWLADHGDGNSISGKSYAINMIVGPEGSADIGSSRIGMYLGNGLSNSGYTDFYVFYRVKIPKNQWPTNIESGTKTGTYIEGNPYTYFASWKHFNVGTGFTSDYDWDGVNMDTCCVINNRYGDTAAMIHIKPSSGIVKPRLEAEGDTNMIWSDLKSNFPTDQWVGVEYHMVLESPAGTGNNGVFQMWLYDTAGNTTQVLNATNVDFRLQGNDDHWFNRIVWGGNNSNSYYDRGDSLNSTYFIDDVVIDDSRIGPSYFSLLDGISDTTPPAAPSGLNVS